jgi:hypothetical protein
MQTNFTNCIIDGTATEGDEVLLDHSVLWPNSIQFNACIIKQKTSLSTEATLDASTMTLLNASTAFKDPSLNNFELKATSQAKGSGVASAVTLDIKDNARANPPSIGCWE